MMLMGGSMALMHPPEAGNSFSGKFGVSSGDHGAAGHCGKSAGAILFLIPRTAWLGAVLLTGFVAAPWPPMSGA